MEAAQGGMREGNGGMRAAKYFKISSQRICDSIHEDADYEDEPNNYTSTDSSGNGVIENDTRREEEKI